MVASGRILTISVYREVDPGLAPSDKARLKTPVGSLVFTIKNGLET